MDILAVTGFIITVASLGYAVYVKRVTQREKRLVYEVLKPISIAEVINGSSGYSLKVIYQQRGQEDVYVDKAFLYYLRILNTGKEAIKKEDIPKGDPLTLVLTNEKILDVALVNTTNETCRVSLDNGERFHTRSTITLSFDFLDYQDGMLIRVISYGNKLNISLTGTVIGMPGGAIRLKEVSVRQEITGLGCIIPIIVTIGLLAYTPFIYNKIMETWDNVWIIFLPIVMLLVSSLLFALAAMIIFRPKRNVRFPSQLAIPDWYLRRMSIMERFAGREIDYED
jgi:hypothetical protein